MEHDDPVLVVKTVIRSESGRRSPRTAREARAAAQPEVAVRHERPVLIIQACNTTGRSDGLALVLSRVRFISAMVQPCSRPHI